MGLPLWQRTAGRCARTASFLLFAIVAVGGMALATVMPPPTQAAVTNTHPRVYRDMESPLAPGVHVPFIAAGTIRLTNMTLGSVECVNLFYGEVWTETEPEGTTEKAYGEILDWGCIRLR
jgi:hypothetical protein